MALSTIGTNSVADSAVTSAKISDGTIATGDIANDAVTGAKLADLDALTVTDITATGTTVGFVTFDKLLLNATDGSATDDGDNLILNGTDATSANADSSILFDDGTNDGSAVLGAPIASFVSDEIKTDKLTGNTSATNVTVSDGSTTMKLQDGLAKVGIYYDLTNNTNQQSWNVTSITDHGTGNMQIFYIESMTGNAVSVYSAQNGTHGDGEIFGSTGNSHYYRIRNTGGTLLDSTQTYSMVHGDLA